MTDLERIEAKLDRLEKLIQRQPISGGWLDLRRASHYSGLSKTTLSRAIQAGKLRASKTSGKILIRQTWLDKFLIFGSCRRLNFSERQQLEDF